MSNKKTNVREKTSKNTKKEKHKQNKKPNTRQLSDIYNWYIGHKR